MLLGENIAPQYPQSPAPDFRRSDMKRAITGFHQDEKGHWVAELVCLHTLHVRHEPPWQDRAWVETETGRLKKIGVMLDCQKCEDGLIAERKTGDTESVT